MKTGVLVPSATYGGQAVGVGAGAVFVRVGLRRRRVRAVVVVDAVVGGVSSGVAMGFLFSRVHYSGGDSVGDVCVLPVLMI